MHSFTRNPALACLLLVGPAAHADEENGTWDEDKLEALGL